MKTFQQFLEESYLILERSKPKFRGTRTPEEIEALRAERSKNQSIHLEPSEISQKIIDLNREKAIHHFNLSMTPEGKLDMSSPHYEKSRTYNLRAFGRELPDYQVLDTNRFRGTTKNMLRNLSRAKRQKEASKGLNPDVVKPSEHPDTHPSKASEFDRIVHKRRRIRNKLERNREAMDPDNSREFRRSGIQNTIGRIPGQLRGR